MRTFARCAALAAVLLPSVLAAAQSESPEGMRSPRDINVPVTDEVKGKIEDLAAEAAKHPDDAFRVAQYGYALTRVGRVREGLVALTRAAGLAPDEPRVLLLVARGQWKDNQLDAALDTTNRIIGSPLATRAEVGEACRLAAAALWETAKLPEAEAMFKKGLERNPNNGALLTSYGAFLSAQQRPAEAVAALTKVGAVSNDPRALAKAANVLQSMGRLEDALPLWAAAADLRPADGDLNFRAAGEEYRFEHWDRTLRFLDRSLKANPNDANAHLMASQALLHLGRFEEARVHATAAQQLGAKGAGETLGAIRLEEGQQAK